MINAYQKLEKEQMSFEYGEYNKCYAVYMSVFHKNNLILI